ncbi:RDD family protein [Schaalia suimastitidis]|uniref:RDD family protein n=1 Tax=Schaalia suimastitidis TaxID=121163 RepID=UPI000410DDEB|nr:RDD family protein [Schaalia suimastitidis]
MSDAIDKAKTSLPRHLGAYRLAGDHMRARAHFVDLLIVLLPAVLLVAGILLRWGGDGATSALGTFAIYVGGVIFAVLAVASTLFLAAGGQTIGMRVAGVRWVKYSTGQHSAAGCLAKLFIEVVLAVPTLGIIPILISFLSHRELNRTWFDQLCDTIAVQADRPGASRARHRYSPLTHAVSAEKTPAAPSSVDSSALDSAQLEQRTDGDHSGIAHADSETSYKRYHLGSSRPHPSSAEHVIADIPALDNEVLGESQWDRTVAHSAINLASVGRSARDSQSVRELSPPLSDVNTLSDLERSIGMRPAGSVRLVFDDGTRYDLVGRLLVGRDPVRVAPYLDAAMLAVSDSERSVSKTHFVLSVENGQVIVTDLHSTNGTRLSSPSGTTRSLPPETPTAVTPGTLVLFGRRRVIISG